MLTIDASNCWIENWRDCSRTASDYLLAGDIAVTDLEPANLIAIDSKSTALPGTL